ncbi:hypothetical protein F0P96_03995 [Hymenobacter busanensis]|uniref:Uncharacterized protein n=1 Tax=Hymenobacter busanensis TaxID=2607656 RepID=A0A7L4ZTK9_9BACT|nr:hypothetical protein [Hymenobacter busanensis]KAA9339787.1 hypothetical protein F0P96_03995 [Hymenobacter busanensis]QHJ06458.1 hypothetical protein GUY19_03750 [Hymenobacter busanensis]
MHLRVLLFGAATSLLASCSQSSITIPGFDAAAWQRDTRACQNTRAKLLPPLDQHRQKLYGLSNGAVNGLLGHPDEEELEEQTQRIYYYYLDPGEQCQPGHPRSKARRLVLRFGALNTVTEVLYSTTPPIGKKAP